MQFFSIYNKRIMQKGKHRKNNNPDTDLSKTLSWLLRHGAIQEGLTIEPSGYVPLEEVMQCLRRKGCKNVDQDRIRHIVASSDKKRFEIEERKHHVFIRATQGHSIKQVHTQELLTKITDHQLYPTVIHGTFSKFWGSIKAGGLKRMSRNHIHFAPGMPKEEGVVSGMRGACDIVIQIDLKAAMKDGIEFYISSNNVILTEGKDGVLPPQYFLKVTGRDGHVIETREQILLEKQQMKVQKKQQVNSLPTNEQLQIKPEIKKQKKEQFDQE